MDLSQKTKIGLNISQAFEGSVPFANITGNFDGMGLSCGALGKTFANGEQQTLVKRFLSRHGDGALIQLMPTKGGEYITLCRKPPAQGMPGIVRWSTASGGVKQPHKRELEAFWTSAGMVAIQVADAENREGKKAQTAVDEWGAEDDLHEFCFFFDIMTQHGSLKGLKRSHVNTFVQQNGGLAAAGEAIADECINVSSSVNHFRDTRRNGHLWKALFPDSDVNSRELFVMGYLRAKKSNPEWVYVALNRRGTFGLGEGFVNGSQHDLRDRMGMGEAPPVVLNAGVDFDSAADTTAAQPPPVPAVSAAQDGEVFRVTASSLNLRSSPEVLPSNRIGVLHHGQLVTRMAVADSKWWQVAARIAGQSLVGHVSKHYLEPAADNPPPSVGAVTVVHLRTQTNVSRARGGGRVFHLNEPNPKLRTGSTPATKRNQVNAIIDYLDVGKSSHKRYKAGGGLTFCNIYAYDYACLCQVFIPRNWWTGASIAKLVQGIPVAPRYNDTVRELRANDIHGWFLEWGGQFGWRSTHSLNELQEAANNGEVGIIVAKRTNVGRPGHIVAVAPETDSVKANRHGDDVFIPVQSQAGSSNFKRKTPTHRFWLGSQFQSFGFWIHE